MSTSDVAIVNRALAKLGEPAILSLTDDSVAGRLANRTYEDIRDTLLREHPWNFAMRRASLAALSTPPAFGFARAFELPADFLRLVRINEEAPNFTEFRLEDGKILTDLPSPLQIIYVGRVTDAASMDPAFQEALAARLALEWANALTQRTAVFEQMRILYRTALANARAVDGQEDFPRQFEVSRYELYR